MEAQKPTICLAYEEKDNLVASEIKAGIEEEGLFYERCDVKKSTSFQMALEACARSHLGIGIGICENMVVVHCEKLKEFHPLFSITSEDMQILRSLGSNVGRYIKGVPFKNQ